MRNGADIQFGRRIIMIGRHIVMVVRIFVFDQSKEQSKMIEKPKTKCDSGTQTDTHILEGNIVKNYEWNEWELRRKAIKLVRHMLFDLVLTFRVYSFRNDSII